jgi:radical SAM superfamily enzyme YgiQ (UPF0313 family)
MGIESGNEFVRKTVMNRDIPEEIFYTASKLCRDAGMDLHSFNMVGLPGEDMAARLDTVKVNARMQTSMEQCTVFYPFKETRLFDIAVEHGLATDRKIPDFFRRTTLSYGRIDRQQIEFIAHFFNILIRFYRLFLRLPGRLSDAVVWLADRFLSSRLVALTIFPMAIRIGLFARKSKSIAAWWRRFRTFDASRRGRQA